MFRDDVPTETITGYSPTEEDLCGLAEWFERYDSASTGSETLRPPQTQATGTTRPDEQTEHTEQMAALAAFPLNVLTDDSTGTPWYGQWDREEYVRTMRQVRGDETGGEVSFESVRTPFFLSGTLAVVFSRSTMTVDGHSHQLDYADVLVREKDGWRFQTMLQPGWGDMLRQQAG